MSFAPQDVRMKMMKSSEVGKTTDETVGPAKRAIRSAMCWFGVIVYAGGLVVSWEAVLVHGGLDQLRILR